MVSYILGPQLIPDIKQLYHFHYLFLIQVRHIEKETIHRHR
jgi:hypothetical protein